MRRVRHARKSVRSVVDFDTGIVDREVKCFAEMGLSISAISNLTGLTANQVIYRLQKCQVKVAAYRSGQSAVAKVFVREVRAANRRALKENVVLNVQKHYRALRTATP